MRKEVLTKGERMCMKKIVKNILVFAAMIISIFTVCTVVQAENKYQEGDYTYTVEFGKATLVKYTGNSSNITVPATLDGKPLVEIENGAFYNNNYINSVILPDTVKKIGQGVFKGCENLQNVHFPTDITFIPEEMFDGCSSLKEFNFSTKIKKIGQGAFRGCSSLKNIVCPSVNSLGFRCFANCTSLQSVIFKKGIVESSGGTFSKCINLETVVFPQGTKVIAFATFEDCKSLKHITLPTSITCIDFIAFIGSGIVDIEIPDSVERCGERIFEDCNSLESVKWFASNLPHCTFERCTSLKSVVLGEKVSKISYLVFEGTTQLETLRIPSYAIVDKQAFSGAEALHTIYGVKGSNAETVAKEVGISFVPVKDASIKLNKTKLTLYTMKGKNTATLKAVVSGSTSTPTWTSSDISVVQVNTSGKIVVKKSGTAYVTVTLGNKSASCKVTVKKPALTVKKKTIVLKKGQSYTISYSAVPAGKATFKSSNVKCVAVNANGKIVAKRKGTAVISVSCNNITQKIKVTVQ